MKLHSNNAVYRWLICRSRKGAWIEIRFCLTKAKLSLVAPVRERGLKFLCCKPITIDHSVAPVRERGLKLASVLNLAMILASRSRKGAWIEIIVAENQLTIICCRSRKGAWIEIGLRNGLQPRC